MCARKQVCGNTHGANTVYDIETDLVVGVSNNASRPTGITLG
jgi:hypothetical protein